MERSLLNSLVLFFRNYYLVFCYLFVVSVSPCQTSLRSNNSQLQVLFPLPDSFHLPIHLSASDGQSREVYSVSSFYKLKGRIIDVSLPKTVNLSEVVILEVMQVDGRKKLKNSAVLFLFMSDFDKSSKSSSCLWRPTVLIQPTQSCLRFFANSSNMTGCSLQVSLSCASVRKSPPFLRFVSVRIFSCEPSCRKSRFFSFHEKHFEQCRSDASRPFVSQTRRWLFDDYFQSCGAALFVQHQEDQPQSCPVNSQYPQTGLLNISLPEHYQSLKSLESYAKLVSVQLEEKMRSKSFRHSHIPVAILSALLMLLFIVAAAIIIRRWRKYRRMRQFLVCKKMYLTFVTVTDSNSELGICKELKKLMNRRSADKKNSTRTLNIQELSVETVLSSDRVFVVVDTRQRLGVQIALNSKLKKRLAVDSWRFIFIVISEEKCQPFRETQLDDVRTVFCTQLSMLNLSDFLTRNILSSSSNHT